MKINTILFSLATIFFLGCNNHLPGKKASYMHSVVDSLNIDKSKNILVYTVNPNDCINCLIGFFSLNNVLSKTVNPKVYVLCVEREIEKNKWIKSMTTINLKDSINKIVLWDKDKFIGINESVSIKKETSLSTLTIYNYQKDTILYTRPIREISSVDDFKAYLEK